METFTESNVYFESQGNLLNGKMVGKSESAYSKTCLYAHSHPMHGGNMDQSIISGTRSYFNQLGYSTLRFNYRGVGASSGKYTGGPGEIRDLINAQKYMLQTTSKPGVSVLFGYDIGAFFSTQVVSQCELFTHQILISPPFDSFDFSGLKLTTKPTLIVFGENSRYINADRLVTLNEFSQACINVEVIPNTTDSLMGKVNALKGKIADFLTLEPNPAN